MENSLNELKVVLKDNRLTLNDIVALDIHSRDDKYGEQYKLNVSLRVGYTEEELNEVMSVLGNHEYDSGFGIEYIEGVVWLTNERWLERMEYDGSEWWELKCYPEIPEHLLK